MSIPTPLLCALSVGALIGSGPVGLRRLSIRIPVTVMPAADALGPNFLRGLRTACTGQALAEGVLIRPSTAIER